MTFLCVRIGNPNFLQFQRQKLTFCILICALLASPQSFGDSLEKALSLFNRGQYDQALTQFQTLKSKKNPDSIYYLARSYFQNGDLVKAKSLFEENLKAFPLHAKSHFLLGSVNLNLVSEANVFKKWGLAKSALASWQRSIELDNKNTEAIYGVASFYLNAPGLVGGDKEKAYLETEKLFKLDNAYGNLLRAAIKQKEGLGEEAENLIISAVKSMPDRAFPTLILADYYWKEQRYNDALTQVNLYRERDRKWNDPDESQTALLSGKIYKALGKTQRAREEFEIVIQTAKKKNIIKMAKEELKKL